MTHDTRFLLATPNRQRGQSARNATSLPVFCRRSICMSSQPSEPGASIASVIIHYRKQSGFHRGDPNAWQDQDGLQVHGDASWRGRCMSYYPPGGFAVHNPAPGGAAVSAGGSRSRSVVHRCTAPFAHHRPGHPKRAPRPAPSIRTAPNRDFLSAGPLGGFAAGSASSGWFHPAMALPTATSKWLPLPRVRYDPELSSKRGGRCAPVSAFYS